MSEYQKQIDEGFVALKETLKQQHEQGIKGHVDAYLDEKLDRINAAIAKNEELLEKQEKAKAKENLRREVAAAMDEVDPNLRSAWINFIRKDKEDLTSEEKSILAMNSKSLNSGQDTQGGYLVLPYFDTAITKRIYETSPMRQVATVKSISTDQYEKDNSPDLADASWGMRDDAYTETSTQTYGRLTIRVMDLYAYPKVSQKLLDDAFLDVEAELLDSIATKMELKENTAFLLGNDPNKQPRGLLTYDAGTSWGQIEQVVSGSAAALTVDGLNDLETALKDGYLANARFMMNRSTLNKIRKLVDANGNAIWSPQLGSEPATLLGYPIVKAADMPNVEAGALAIAFGDFRRAYTIVDRMGTRVLRDPYTAPPYVKFVTTRRVGGGVDNFEAVKLLKVAAS